NTTPQCQPEQNNKPFEGFARDVKKNSYRPAAVCLGFLCLLLVAGLITRTYLCEYYFLHWGTEMALLQTSNNNQSKEIDQLQTSNTDLIREKNQLETRCNKLTRERDHFYYISSVKKNWNESRNDCLQRGADSLSTDYRQLPDRIWIGLKYNESTEWKWVDETPLTQCYWLHGEPNGVEKDEHCVEIKRNNADKGWNDAPCTVTKTWICEKKVAL
uniref:C-type lectin domain-containing protein n=1 Tax=Amphiprion percula TaxID=161767 RepID=A0A3P8RU08_AMPPE